MNSRKGPWLPVGGVEARVVILGFMLLFCVLGGYFAVRPVRETIGTILGREATQNLWLYTAFFAILIVPFYGWLVAHVRRAVLLPTIYGFMAVAFVVTAMVFENDPKNADARQRVLRRHQRHEPDAGVGVLELHARDPDQRADQAPVRTDRRGRHAGALVGPLLTSLFVTRHRQFWSAVSRREHVRRGRLPAAPAARAMAFDGAGGRHCPAQLSERDRALGGNPFAGFMLVMRNPYLLGITLFVVGISAINTFLYFEQLQLVEEQFEEITKRTQVFASLDAIVQALVVMSQLFLTGFIATRLGVIVLLVTIPIIMVFGLTVFAIFGTFIVLAVAMVMRRWGEYAFIRPGREMLFSKVDKESKYKAKNVFDVAVYRIADAGFAQLKKFLEGIGMSGIAEAMFTAGRCRVVGHQRLVARPSPREGKRAEVRRVASEKSALRIGLDNYRARSRNLGRLRGSLEHALERHPFLSLRPAAAPPGTAIRLRPALSLSRCARGNLPRRCARLSPRASSSTRTSATSIATRARTRSVTLRPRRRRTLSSRAAA